jgi:hypothetical protein
MRSYQAWLGILVVATSAAWAQSDDQAAKRVAAHELLEAEQWDKILDATAKVYAKLYVDNLLKTDPTLPKGRLAEFQALIEAHLMQTKKDYIVQTEAKIAQEISLQDLQSAIAFYKSPVGQHLGSAQAALTPLMAEMQETWASNAVAHATKDLNTSAKAVK